MEKDKIEEKKTKPAKSKEEILKLRKEMMKSSYMRKDKDEESKEMGNDRAIRESLEF